LVANLKFLVLLAHFYRQFLDFFFAAILKACRMAGVRTPEDFGCAGGLLLSTVIMNDVWKKSSAAPKYSHYKVKRAKMH